MSAIEFVASYYYNTVWYFTLLVLCWATVLYYIGSDTQKMLHAEGSPIQTFAILFTVMATFYLGLRPVSDAFIDMRLYAYSFNNTISDYRPMSFSTEWLWTNIRIFCRRNGININEYFLLIEIITRLYRWHVCLCMENVAKEPVDDDAFLSDCISVLHLWH